MTEHLFFKFCDIIENIKRYMNFPQQPPPPRKRDKIKKYIEFISQFNSQYVVVMSLSFKQFFVCLRLHVFSEMSKALKYFFEIVKRISFNHREIFYG